MRNAIEFPEPLFRQGQEIARLQGVTIEELAIRALERELHAAPGVRSGQRGSSLPLVPSKTPGVLDLKDYDFDDLLA